MERRFNWDHISKLQVLDWIPDHYDIEEQHLFRTPLLLVNHLFWNQLLDYKFYNQINSTDEPVITVHAYYTTAIFNLRRLKVVEIPANVPFNQTIKIVNNSPLRENSIKQARLENCLDFNKSQEFRTYLENIYGIINLEEYCSPELEVMEIKGDQSVQPFDRVWVGWAIDIIVGIYREDMEGNFSLVGCNDYLYNFIPIVYPKSNNYWTMRVKEETVTNNLQSKENPSKSIIRPGGLRPDDSKFDEVEKEEYSLWKGLIKI